MKRICQLLQIKKIHTTAFHTESNGALERSHRVLKEYLRNYINTDLNNWDDYIQFATFTYNTTPHSRTQFTPFELMFGEKANIPSSVQKKPDIVYNYDDYFFELKNKLQNAHEIAKENLFRSKILNKNQYDKKVHIININIGDKVLLENTTNKKLESKYDGPYEVIKIISDVNTKILIKGKEKIVNNNRLKLFNE